MSDILHKLNFKIADASSEYKTRRANQMIRFFTFSALSIFTLRIINKQTIIRQYIPTLFQQNHSPPTSYNFTTDAAVAVGAGTLACGSISGMFIFGLAWILDVSNFKEFGYRMKSIMGGYENLQKLNEMEMDEESKLIQDGLNDLLDGKFDNNNEEDIKSEILNKIKEKKIN
ncbi:AIM11 [Candida pseudojiufengensis]|uniref:AIM11 n=1 Tax=Candida pseudojiufengensis TaxID=497109 RepID=UPI00222499F7|nr:AIM11 [Candida pseudojiufengensis]KAI5959584.1 AIM11 [Candida pseudojiufengensis]